MYYTIVAAGLACADAAMIGSLPLVVIAAGMWALCTVGFAISRLRHTRRDLPHMAEMLCTSVLVPPLSVFWRWYGACKFRALFP